MSSFQDGRAAKLNWPLDAHCPFQREAAAALTVGFSLLVFTASLLKLRRQQPHFQSPRLIKSPWLINGLVRSSDFLQARWRES